MEVTMDQIIQLISTVGFPIAITVFVMLRLDKSLKAMEEALKELIIKFDVTGGK